jgi:hypothetical protein
MITTSQFSKSLLVALTLFCVSGSPNISQKKEDVANKTSIQGTNTGVLDSIILNNQIKIDNTKAEIWNDFKLINKFK